MRFYFKVSLLSIVIMCMISLSVHAKNYTIDNVRIFAEILQDGKVSIKEFRTYTFDGSYSQANYELSRQGFDHVSEITVYEEGQIYILSESEMPGTFFIEESDRSIDIVWNYEATDETRTFVISYVLEGAIIVGLEHAQFFWTYLSGNWERATQSLNVELTLPGEHDGTAKGWVYGSSEKVSINYNSGGFSLESLERLNKPNEIRVRYIFPTSLIQTSVTHPDFSLYRIVDEENLRELERQEAAAWEESVTPFLTVSSILVIALSFMSFIFLYGKYGRRHHPSQQIPQVTFRPPMNLKPALASWLVYSRNVMPSAMAATLFDLARQGFFLIKEQTETTKILKKDKQVVVLELVEPRPDTSKLSDSESALMDFIRDRMQEDNRLDKIFSASNSKLSRWYAEWTQKVSEEGKALDLIDKESIKGMKYSMWVQFIILVLSICLFVMVQIPEPVIAGFLGFVMILVSFSIQRYKPDGQELYLKFYSYRNGLKLAAKQRLVNQSSFSASSKDMHMIYAVAFGITGKKLESILSHLEVDESTIHWMLLTSNPAMGTSAIVKSIGQVTTSVVISGAGASAGVAGGGAGGGAR